MTYFDGTERQAVDCPSCKMQRWADVDCHHCGNSAVSCLKGLLHAHQQARQVLQVRVRELEARLELLDAQQLVISGLRRDNDRLQAEVERLKADILEEQVKYAQQCLKMLPPKIDEMCKEIINAYVFQLDERLSLTQQLAAAKEKP